ncbi:MAG: c-type cytochrome [Hyphomicrobiales bacterium]|nr:c-type cytochrome [Hyphomicrobiales bacterium]
MTTPAQTPFPAGNPYSAAKLSFGRAAFYNPQLSGDGSIACASCHIPQDGFADHLAASRGVTGHAMPLRTPTLLDAAWGQIYGWEGKFPSLAAVVTGAMVNPINMGVTEASLQKTMEAAPDLKRRYRAAFPGERVSIRNVARGLATYVRTLVAGPAPFDRWQQGHEHAISAAAKHGFQLFEGKAHCAVCHKGFAFTDRAFHDIGASTGKDLGRGAQFPTSIKLQHAFKTPTLRDVALHAPYMHNGALPTLTAVVNLYNKGGIKRPSLDDNIHPLGLSKADVHDIVAFLKSLTATPRTGETSASLH